MFTTQSGRLGQVRRIQTSRIWRTRRIDRTGKGKRRRRILEDQTPKPSHMQRQEGWQSRARAPKMYAQRFYLQDGSLTAAGQRETPPRPPRRPPPRRSTPDHRRRRWPLRCGQDNAHQESDQTLHQADALLAVWAPHCRHLEAPPPHIHRMPVRLACQYDRYCKGCRHLSAYD